MKKLLLLLLCVPLIGLGQCISGDCENGYGTYIFGEGPNEGEKYIGEWMDGEKNGQGTLTLPDGEKHEGTA